MWISLGLYLPPSGQSVGVRAGCPRGHFAESGLGAEELGILARTLPAAAAFPPRSQTKAICELYTFSTNACSLRIIACHDKVL